MMFCFPFFHLILLSFFIHFFSYSYSTSPFFTTFLNVAKLNFNSISNNLLKWILLSWHFLSFHFFLRSKYDPPTWCPLLYVLLFLFAPSFHGTSLKLNIFFFFLLAPYLFQQTFINCKGIKWYHDNGDDF